MLSLDKRSLQLLQRPLARLERKQHLSCFLLNHGDVVKYSAITWLDVHCLRKGISAIFPPPLLTRRTGECLLVLILVEATHSLRVRQSLAHSRVVGISRCVSVPSSREVQEIRYMSPFEVVVGRFVLETRSALELRPININMDRLDGPASTQPSMPREKIRE